MKFIEISGSITLNASHIIKVFRKTLDNNIYRVTVISLGEETFWDYDSFDHCEHQYRTIVNQLIQDE